MAALVKLLLVAFAYAAALALVESAVYTYCDLNRPEPALDPSIITSEQASQQRLGSLPRAKLASALRGDRAARSFLRGVERTQGRSAQSAQRAALRTPSKTGPKKFDAPTVKDTLCDQKEVQIIAGWDNGDLCWVVDPQVLAYFDCKNRQCKLHNAFPNYLRYYCEPETFLFTTAMLYCDTRAPFFRFKTFYVPVKCGCKEYKCDLAKKFKF